jgi:hypothetical protein
MVVNPGLTRRGTGAGFIKSLTPAAWFRYGIGVSVSQWDDQSGNGRHLLQATATNQPAVQSDGSLLFDGADNFMKCSAFTLNQPCCYYILFKSITYTNNDRVCGGNAANGCDLIQDPGTPTLRIFAGGAGGVDNGDLAVGTYGAVVCGFNGASSFIGVNNGAVVTGNPGTNNMAGFTLGSSGTPANYSNIQVKEVILFASAHDSATRSRVIRYLSRVGNLAL